MSEVYGNHGNPEGNPRRSRTKSPIDDYLKKSLLANINKSELKFLRVAIRRGNGIGGGAPHLPLERSIDDPVRICSFVHYRKDKDKKPKPPIFGKGIKVNQDFTENRRVFTYETIRARRSRSRRKQRARSRSPVKYRRSRSVSIRDKKSKSLSRNRSRSRKRDKNTHLRSRSRDRSKSKSHRSRSQRSRSPRSRSKSRYPSRSRERRYSSDRRKYKNNDRIHSSKQSRYSRSSSRSLSPREHTPSCPLYGLNENRQKKSLTPTLRSKRNTKRSRSRSYDGGSRSKISQLLDNLPSTSRERLSSERPYYSSSPIKGDRRERQSKLRLSPDYKISHHSGPHEEYGYFEGWVPGPRLPTGRGGGFAMRPFYAPSFHPRGMMPGPLMHPGMMMHRMPIMAPYGPYRPAHLPIYNSGAVRRRGGIGKPATITISDQTNKSLPESERKGNENDERKEETKE